MRGGCGTWQSWPVYNWIVNLRISLKDNKDKYRWLCWEEIKKQYGETVAQKKKERRDLC